MKSQSAEENQVSSQRIEYLINNDLKQTVRTYLSRYSKTLEQKLGLTRDDLINDIREQIWKGLITHDPNKKANLKTYLNHLIKNRFGVLFQRSKIQKNNMINYYADFFCSEDSSNEAILTEENGETIFMRRQAMMQNQALLSNKDRLIYEDLQLGLSLEEMCQAHKMSRIEVTASIHRILELVKRSG
jgi:DNA-directed RNA polymerase specialized sigma24 family protein